MDIYGESWKNHTERVKAAWLSKINQEDTVIIAGDISWGLRLKEAMADLDWVHQLPGKKVMVKGNHDPWWASVTKLNRLYDDMFFLQNSFYPYEDYAICGSRGWVCPGSSEFTAHDEKIYQREILRVKASFEAAVNAGYERFIGVLHFPPANEKKEDSGFTEIFEHYQAETVVYGHLHGERGKYPQSEVSGRVAYHLISCDALRCDPMRLL